MVDIFNNLIDRVANDLNKNDQIRAVIHHPALDRPINLLMMRRGDLDAERIIREIESMIQSNEDFNIDEYFVMDLIKIHLSRAQGHLKRKLPIEVLLKNKKSVVRIRNHDSLCMVRVLVVAIAKATNDPN